MLFVSFIELVMNLRYPASALRLFAGLLVCCSLFPTLSGRAEESALLRLALTEEEIPPPEKVSRIHLILHTTPGVRFAGYLVAKENGYYEKAGLPPVTISFLNETTEELSELRSGRATFSTAWTPRAYRLNALGGGVVLIAQVAQKSSSLVLVRADRLPEIQSLGDLGERRLGVYFRSEENALCLANSLGIMPNFIHHRHQGVDLLRNGAVDALCCTTDTAPILFRYSGLRNDLLELPFTQVSGGGLPEDCLICTKAFLFRHPDICRRFVLASWQGWRTALENRSETLKILKKYYESEQYLFDAVIVSDQLDEWEKILRLAPDPERNGGLSEDAFEQMRDMMIQSGLVEKESSPKHGEFFYNVADPETVRRIKQENSETDKEP